MEFRTLGETGCKVSRLGIGLAQIGAFELSEEKAVRRLLLTALDLGITFFDTAASYRNSEELIGRAISDRPGLARFNDRGRSICKSYPHLGIDLCTKCVGVRNVIQKWAQGVDGGVCRKRP